MSVAQRKILSDARRARRWDLDLGSLALTGPTGPVHVEICSISATGMKLEGEVALAPGDRLQVELPNGDNAAARVVWSQDGALGCEFDKPLTHGAISAARLKSASSAPGIGSEKMQFIETLDERWSWQHRMRLIVATSGLLWAVLIAGVLATH